MATQQSKTILSIGRKYFVQYILVTNLNKDEAIMPLVLFIVTEVSRCNYISKPENKNTDKYGLDK